MTVRPAGLLPLLTSGVAENTRPPMFRPMEIASSGLSAQRLRMEVIATNIANAETTHVDGGGPYRRRIVRLEEAAVAGAPPSFLPLPSEMSEGKATKTDPVAGLAGVQTIAIEEDPSEGPLVYDPGHPDANAQGWVRQPNVRITDEIVDLMEARRVYEANATVFQAAKQLLRRALEI
ncbi:MAG: Flagellar basal-body rod protein FlgC [Gemmatimonadaceae bacterium]|nr:Flagellar basal-body rod protein FlgC [Gemmatimonadaceae bacterium]